MVIFARDGRETIHLYLVVRCPTDISSGVAWAPRKEVSKSAFRRAKDPGDGFVIDRFISNSRAEDDSGWLIQVRWAGFSAADDTRQPVLELPSKLVRRNER